MPDKQIQYSLPDDGGSITASDLERKDRETQLDVMRTWFYENYEDPAENTPYEGGYVYIYGGPFDARQELNSEFGGIVSDEIIEELADELSDISYEWTSTDREGFDEFEIEIEAGRPTVFENSVFDILGVFAEPIQSPAREYVNRLLYVNVVTALESFLSDFFTYRINQDPNLLRKFVETTPAFKEQKIPVSDVFRAMGAIEKRAESYLSSLVWHRLKIVAALYKNVLDIEFPDTRELHETVITLRHELVHRNGKKKDGNNHIIAEPDIRNAIRLAQILVDHIEKRWAEISTPTMPDDSLPF
jgi:hypothetical protein